MALPATKAGGILIAIPRETTFQLPEGSYAATLTAIRKFIRQTNRGSQEWVRFLFEVNLPSRSKFVNLAGRSFKLDFNNGWDLRNFLTGLLGRKYFHERSGGQINLDELLDLKCEVVLVHYTDGRHEHPMVVVDACLQGVVLNEWDDEPDDETPEDGSLVIDSDLRNGTETYSDSLPAANHAPYALTNWAEADGNVDGSAGLVLNLEPDNNSLSGTGRLDAIFKVHVLGTWLTSGATDGTDRALQGRATKRSPAGNLASPTRPVAVVELSGWLRRWTQ